jgi:hypothetical protein
MQHRSHFHNLRRLIITAVIIILLAAAVTSLSIAYGLGEVLAYAQAKIWGIFGR